MPPKQNREESICQKSDSSSRRFKITNRQKDEPRFQEAQVFQVKESKEVAHGAYVEATQPR